MCVVSFYSVESLKTSFRHPHYKGKNHQSRRFTCNGYRRNFRPLCQGVLRFYEKISELNLGLLATGQEEQTGD